jgi:hypothetical protein
MKFSRLAFLALAVAAACGGQSQVWLVVKNQTGGDIKDVVVDYGGGTLSWQIMGPGYTQAGWGKAYRKPRLLSISYVEGGVKRSQDIGWVLNPDMDGGSYRLTLKRGGGIEKEIEYKASGRKRGPIPPWLLNLAAAVAGLLVLTWAARLALAAARRAKTVVAALTRDELVEKLGLVRKRCPIPMFSMNPVNPAQWYEGKSGGRMLGLIEELFWLGEPDEITLWTYKRKGSDVFGKDYAELGQNCVFTRPELKALIDQLSPGITGLTMLSRALEAHFHRGQLTPEALAKDLRLLGEILDLVDSSRPPLCRAVEKGDENAVRELLKKGVNLEERDLNGAGALELAAWGGRTAIAGLLLEAGAKARPEAGFPIHAAARKGHLDIVRLLLDHGVPVDERDAPNDTPLMEAVKGGHSAVVDLLLARGADADARNTDGLSPKGAAVHYGDKLMQERLEFKPGA